MSGEDRQSELAREHKERQEQRAAQAAKAKRNTVIGAGVAVVAVVGGIIAATAVLGSSDAGKPEAAASPTPSASTSAPASTAPSIAPTAPPKKAGPVSCTYKKDTADVPKKFVGFPPSKPSLKWKTMKIVTNIGDVEIAVDPAVTPCTLNSFAFLAKKNFYDNTPCYRYVTPDVSGLHLMQCGDPLAKGDGKNMTDGQGTAGYVYGDENLGMPIVEGIVFMAQAGEDKGQNNSQFVFSLSNDNSQIPADYTTFGMVTKGLDVMKAVAKNQDDLVINEGDITGNGGATAPKKPVIIKDLQLLTK